MQTLENVICALHLASEGTCNGAATSLDHTHVQVMHTCEAFSMVKAVNFYTNLGCASKLKHPQTVQNRATQ